MKTSKLNSVSKVPLLLSFSVFLFFTATEVSFAQLTGGNGFLKGNYVEVGMAQCGSFGSSINAPFGYHPRVAGSARLGFVADPAKDGWNVGSPNYFGDYFLPGTPEEGWGMTINGVSRNNNQVCGEFNIAGSIINYSSSASEVSATWQGATGGLSITKRTYVPLNSLYFITEVTIVNTSASQVNNVFYMRNVDPDHEQTLTGNFVTTNSIVFQNPDGCNRALVSARGVNFGAYLGLGSIDSRARVTHGGFSNRNAQSIWNGSGLFTSGTRTADEAISLAFNLGNIAPNQVVKFAYAYILSPADLNTALASTNINFSINSANYTTGSSANICSGSPVPIDLMNTGTYTSWSWQPNTGLNQYTGTSVIATVTSPITYIATGTGPCGTVQISIVLNPVVSPSVGDAGAITGPSSILLGATGINYSIPAVSGATSYSWTLPPGSVITSGANTNSITFNGSNTSWCGNISVTPSNNCNVGGSSSTPACLGNELNTGAVSLALCAGQSLEIPYTASGIFNTGNVFTSQLSSPTGDFSTPTAIGSLTSTSLSGNISVVIPSGTASGTGYRIRIVASNPVLNGIDNGSNIAINAEPTVLTRDITALLDAVGTVVIAAADIDDGSTDNCGIVSYTLDIASFDCSNIGANTVTLTVTNAFGNSASATATVTVEDTIAPTVVTRNITVQLDANGNADIVAGDVNDGSTDNCAIGAYALDITSFDCSNIGANTVTLTATDASGNQASAVATVTIEDTIAPTVVTRNISVQLDDDGNAFIAAGDVNDGSTDNCAIGSYTLDITSFDCSNVGANMVTLTATDANGNSASAEATVTVEDTTAPVVVTKNITVQLDAGGNASIAAGDVNDGSIDNCTTISLELEKAEFTCEDVGDNTITLTVTDSNGNSASATAVVTILDSQAPTITGPADISLNNDPGLCSAEVTLEIPGTADNCEIASVANDHPSSTFQVGETIVTWTVTDSNGNSATATQKVTVSDDEVPVMSCPEDIILTACVETATWAPPAASDNCSVTVVQTDGPDPGSIFENGTTTTIAYTASDPSGNETSCSFTITRAPELTSVATTSNNQLYFGYGNQSAIVTAKPAGGTAPYAISITMDRPLNCNVITSSGDESWTGGQYTGLESNTICPGSGPGLIPVSSSSPGSIDANGSYSVTVALMQDAVFTATITDANGCTTQSTATVYADDVRCFAGNSGNTKVSICHRTNSSKNPCVSICVAESAIADHLSHGDYLGTCAVDCSLPTPGARKSADSESKLETGEAASIQVFPNPMQSTLTIRLVNPDNEQVDIQMMDVTGRRITTKQPTLSAEHTYDLDTEQLASGLYFLRVNVGKLNKTIKLSKE